MVGSLQESRKVILKDKLIQLNQSIQTTKLSQILAADLTSRDRSSNGFWNKYSKAISTRLWCPRQIGSQDTVQTNFSAGSSVDLERHSQYSAIQEISQVVKNSQTICWPSSQYSQQDTMEVENTITRKIRFYPTATQKKMMDKCFGAHRYFYNSAVKILQECKKTPSFYSLRDKVVINKNDMKEGDEWMNEIPYDTRQLAVKNCLGSYKASVTLKKRGFIKEFTMNFLTKKDRSQVFYINEKALKNNKLFVRKLKKDSTIKFRKRMKKWVSKISNQGDFPIIKQANRYYMCYVIKKKSKPVPNREEICALDPGVRTFQTYYSKGEHGKIGHGFCDKVKEIFRKIDNFNSAIDKNSIRITSRVRYKLKRRIALLRIKVTNKVKDLHWKAASFLTKKYKTILIPIFQSKKIAERSANKWLNRYMLQLSHFTFRQRLISKARLTNCNVIECAEPWTSKTCGVCGNIKSDLGNKKIYKCRKCGSVIDRDINGARNILIRSLTKYYAC